MNEATERKERRSKLFYIDPQFVVWMLNGFQKHGTFMHLRACEEIPDGAQVVSLNANWERRCLVAEIEHPSFDVVPDGMYPPNGHDNGMGAAVSLRMFKHKLIADDWLEVTQPLPEAETDESWRDRPSQL